MYALLRGVDGLSAGTRVELLSHPTIEPVRVRTLSPIGRYVQRSWFDNDKMQHHEAIRVSEWKPEFNVPRDNLVKLRRRSR